MKQAIVLFKPDALEVRDEYQESRTTVADMGRLMLVESGLTIVQENTPHLTPDDVYAMYERVLKPNPQDDAIWGTQWKREVIAHLTSRPLEALLLEDGYANDPISKSQMFKDKLRANYGDQEDVVRNLVHVPDEDELDLTHAILFDSTKGVYG